MYVIEVDYAFANDIECGVYDKRYHGYDRNGECPFFYLDPLCPYVYTFDTLEKVEEFISKNYDFKNNKILDYYHTEYIHSKPRIVEVSLNVIKDYEKIYIKETLLKDYDNIIGKLSKASSWAELENIQMESNKKLKELDAVLYEKEMNNLLLKFSLEFRKASERVYNSNNEKGER